MPSPEIALGVFAFDADVARWDCFSGEGYGGSSSDDIAWERDDLFDSKFLG